MAETDDTVQEPEADWEALVFAQTDGCGTYALSVERHDALVQHLAVLATARIRQCYDAWVRQTRR